MNSRQLACYFIDSSTQKRYNKDIEITNKGMYNDENIRKL